MSRATVDAMVAAKMDRDPFAKHDVRPPVRFIRRDALTDDEIAEIHRLHGEGLTYRQVAKRLGYGPWVTEYHTRYLREAK